MCDYISKLRAVDYSVRRLAEQIADLRAYTTTEAEAEDVSIIESTADELSHAVDAAFEGMQKNG